MPPKKTQPNNDNYVVLSASQMLEMAAALPLATTSASQLLRMAAASSSANTNTPTTLPPSFVPSDPYLHQHVENTFSKLTIHVNSLFAAGGAAAESADDAISEDFVNRTQTSSILSTTEQKSEDLNIHQGKHSGDDSNIMHVPAVAETTHVIMDGLSHHEHLVNQEIETLKRAHAIEMRKKDDIITGLKKELTAEKMRTSVDIPTSEQKGTVRIEACKQWQAFKTRAHKIVKAVGNQATVLINQDKPGKGNFVVTVDGVATPIVSLVGMKRPFPALKALDMDAISADVVAALS